MKELNVEAQLIAFEVFGTSMSNGSANTTPLIS